MLESAVEQSVFVNAFGAETFQKKEFDKESLVRFCHLATERPLNIILMMVLQQLLK
jgi:hypothetical protein